MRLQFLTLPLIGACLWLGSGCNRLPEGELIAETNEPSYEEGRRLLRQGKEQAALAAFTRVIESRSDGAPESHLEVGLLYEEEIKDPIAAIYHFRKYLELKSNSPQSDLVRQQIDNSIKSFARTLPAQPLENQILRNDLLDVVEKLKKENNRLKDEVAGLRGNAALAGVSRGSVADLTRPSQPSSPSPRPSPFTSVPISDLEDRPVARPTRSETAPANSAPNRRTHAVVKGDTLYGLARRYYNAPGRVKDIVAANRGSLNSANDPLRIGMQLVIPE
jgi:tetratricopeptide (TPR) repeat protein